MSRDTIVTGSKLTALANSIRTKAGTQASMTLDQMKTAVDNISTGGGFEVEYKKLLQGGNLGDVVIPSGVTALRDSCFCNIVDNANYGDLTINSISFPATLKRLGASAFNYVNFSSQYVLDLSTTAIDSIGTECFSNAKNLKKIILPNFQSDYSADLHYYSLSSGIIKNSQVEEVEMPANCGVTFLSHTFRECRTLKKVKLSNNITTLSEYSFFQCTKLETINIPASVTSAYNAFSSYAGLTKLKYVTIAQGFQGDGLDLSASTLYSASTIVSWLNALADLTGQTAKTLYIGTPNINKLTAAEIAIATNKNWNLA